MILVRVDGGVIIIHEFIHSEKDKLIIKTNKIFSSPENEIRKFPVNKYGFYDIEES